MGDFRKIWIIPFFLIFPLLDISGQENYTHKVFTTSDGLAHNHIYSMIQDTSGYLWLATWDGLSRFDGSHFKNYYHDPNDPITIPYFQVKSLAIDKQNTLWILANQICRYNPQEDNFITYRPGKENRISSSIVSSFSLDTRGDLFILGNQGFEIFDNRSGRFITAKIIMNEYSGYRLENGFIYIDKNNALWIYCEADNFLFKGKIIYSDRPANTSILIQKRFKPNFLPVSFMNFRFNYKILQLTDKTSLVISNNGLYVIDENNNKITEIQFPELLKNTVITEDLIWSSPGITCFYSANQHKTTLFTFKEAYWAQSFLLDFYQNLWFGGVLSNTSGTGLIQISKNQGKFTQIISDRDFQNTSIAVYSVCEDHENNIWVGTKDWNSVLKIKKDNIVSRIEILPRYLRNKMINPRTIFEDKNDHLWVGFLEEGYLFRSSSLKNDFKEIYPGKNRNPENGPIHAFKVIKQYGPGTLVADGYNGICIIDEFTSNFKFQYCDHTSDFYSLYVDTDLTIWAGRSGTLIHLDNTLKPIKEFIICDGQYNIESICPGDSDILWLSLLGGGICKFNKETEKNILYTIRNGLANNTTYEILKDSRNNLWVSTDKGLSMFNVSTCQFVNYDKDDGLEIQEFNSDAAFSCRDGRMLFGGMGGVVGFYPDSLYQQNRMGFSSFTIEDIFETADTCTERLRVLGKNFFRLKKGVTSISIEFSNVEFKSPLKIKFRYRLRGLSDNWIILEPDSRRIFIPGLKPGKFIFELEKTDSQGDWTKSKPINIVVPPYFYQTLFFKSAIEAFGFILVLVFLYMYYRHFRIKNQQKYTQLKLITIQQQLNPHFLSNALTALESLISAKNELRTNEYICEINRLMRNLIDYRGKEYISFSDELSLINTYLNIEQIRLENRFTYNIDTKEVSFQDFCLAPFLIQPFLENSIKHGILNLPDKSGWIRIRFEKPIGKSIVCYIEDNGIGISEAQRQPKIEVNAARGLYLIRERYKIFNSLYKTNLKFSVSELLPGEKFPGTRVRIEIPVLTEKK